jgi:hypothetical protein
MANSDLLQRMAEAVIVSLIALMNVMDDDLEVDTVWLALGAAGVRANVGRRALQALLERTYMFHGRYTQLPRLPSPFEAVYRAN